jgi:hypothetical protein
MKLNPSTISWTNPTQYVDGTPFGPEDFAGYEFGYRPVNTGDYALTVAVPVTFSVTSLDLSALSLPQLVDLDLSMRTVARNGEVSEWADPVQIRYDQRRPLAPSAVAVS